MDYMERKNTNRKVAKPIGIATFVMELPTGIEPVTSALPRLHSTYWAMEAYSEQLIKKV